MKLGFSWSADPHNFLKHVETTVQRKTEIVAEQFFNSVVLRSPVFTGSYRASWKATVGPNLPVHVVGGSKDNPLSAPRWPGLKVKFGESINITNGAPYWERIENGWSGQAPYGVVRMALSEIE